ncbi:MAG: hypothetical protein RBT75_10310 [Anaerolineae bacterium]|nr:hypothetical protein [Anaerolineae bacterium]
MAMHSMACSTSLATDVSGTKVSEQRSPVFQAHLPYGETRSGSMLADRQFTGQRRWMNLLEALWLA